MLAIAEFQKQEGTKTGGYFYLGRKKKKKKAVQGSRLTVLTTVPP